MTPVEGKEARLQHLLRRAAFGFRSSEWAAWSAMDEETALKTLVDYDSIPDAVDPLPMDKTGTLVAGNDPDSLRRYWMLRFCETSRPLEEVMTLFWHGHFATSDYKVQNASIEWRQNQLFRKHAMGNFRELLGHIAVDPAMLIWLDGQNSKKAAPNENFSRELLELFTMGVDGGYTEKDVKEGAKAFTGWSYDDDRTKVNFNIRDHNFERKHYLGVTGDLSIHQALDIVARHPSTARFISKKLFEYFVFPDPPATEIDRLSKVYFDTNYSIRELVRAVLSSPYFYSEQAHYAQIKNPTQHTVMVVKTLDLPYRWMNDMANYADQMGQRLLDPPNVKGWKSGRNWINTTTMTARLNFATHAVDQLRYRGLVRPRITAALAAMGRDPEKAFSDPEYAVLAIWNWLIPGKPIPDGVYKELVGYVQSNAPKKPNKDFYWNRAGYLVELVLTCPDYQLA